MRHHGRDSLEGAFVHAVVVAALLHRMLLCGARLVRPVCTARERVCRLRGWRCEVWAQLVPTLIPGTF